MKEETGNRARSFFRVIAIILVVIFLALLTANQLFGMVLADVAEEVIRGFFEAEGTFRFEVSNIWINPLAGSLKLKNIRLTDNQSLSELTARSVSLSVGMMDMISWFIEIKNHREPSVLRFAKLDGKVIKYKEKDSFFNFKMEKVNLVFSGELSPKAMANKDYLLPRTRQNLKMAVWELGFSTEFDSDVFKGVASPEPSVGRIDKIDVSISYLPDNTQVRLNSFKLVSDIFKLDIDGYAKYIETASTIRTKEFDIRYSLNTAMNGVFWGDPSKTGSWSLGNLNATGFVTASYTETGAIDNYSNSASISGKGIIAVFSGDLKEDLEKSSYFFGEGGAPLDKISIKNMNLKYGLDNGRLKINETMIESNLFNATAEADIQLDPAFLEKSSINLLNIHLTQIHPGLNSAIEKLEAQIGPMFPKVGDDIVFDATGTLEQPVIKGLNDKENESDKE